MKEFNFPHCPNQELKFHSRKDNRLINFIINKIYHSKNRIREIAPFVNNKFCFCHNKIKTSGQRYSFLQLIMNLHILTFNVIEVILLTEGRSMNIIIHIRNQFLFPSPNYWLSSGHGDTCLCRVLNLPTQQSK